MNTATTTRSFAVVGAGIAGLACATELAASGHHVTVIDKGRKPGGRVATRQERGAPGQVFQFDHGAQFATARGEAFSTAIARLAQAGRVAPWPAASTSGKLVWIGTPGMSALPNAMVDGLVAKGVDIHTQAHVGWIGEDRSLSLFPAASTSPGFVSQFGGNSVGPFDAVLVTVPAPQAHTLLAAMGHRFAAEIARARYAPCWAVMASFATGCAAADVIRPEHSPFACVSRNNAKPGHAGNDQTETWVMHASGAWSRAHLEETPDEVLHILLAEFTRLTGQTATPLTTRAHRWRYALVEQSLDLPCLWDEAAKFGLGGDYFLGPRIEAAYDSGLALARTAIASFSA
jgi:predicted NAD/FAD-dependent oxidoreductase